LKLAKLRARAQQRIAKQAPSSWRDWLPLLFPNLFYHPFAARHDEFWGHIETIHPGIKPPAFFAVWARGGGKTTNAEAAAVYLGARERRKFCLYTRSTQDKANESVMNIAAMLESKRLAEYYPQMAERKLGKYGNSKGWRVNTLRCANGFNVVALGYDAAVRGIKIEEYRPDIIIIDDVDSKDDTYDSTQKKIRTLTRDILPAGSTDCAVIGIQNLVHHKSIFTQIAEKRAEFLYDRIVSGPYKAVDGLEYERDTEGKYHIVGGVATWMGQDISTCEAQINEWGVIAFLEEAQNLVKRRTGRIYHAFTDANIGPDSRDLDYSKVSGYYHSHDFGAVNHVWGLWAKIGKQYFLIHEEKLPEGTTEARARRIKEVWRKTVQYLVVEAQKEHPGIALEEAIKIAMSKIIAGWGGAGGEKQYRLDFQAHGVSIRTPPTMVKSSEDEIVESQVRHANRMFESKELMICSNMVYTLDQLDNCVRDDKGGILDKASYHFLDGCIRYFSAGISTSGWVR
jgi:hypothetical protein